MKIRKKYIMFAKKLGMMCIVLLGVSMLSFLLLTATNKDTAEIVVRRTSLNATTEQIEMKRIELGLDKPLHLRYLFWLESFLTGDFGISLTTFNPILTDLREHLPVTGILVLLSLVWIIVITIPVSLFCAFKKNSLFDHVIRIFGIIGICMPAFVLGIFLLLLFAVHLHLFPVAPKGSFTDYIMPSFALAFPTSCAMIRVLRASLLTEMSKDYCTFARAKGLSDFRILCRHALKNALPPFITLFFQYIGYQLAGSAVVEKLFSLQGIGDYLLSGIFIADTVPTAYCVMIVAAVFVVSNILGDVINRILCPWTERVC